MRTSLLIFLLSLSITLWGCSSSRHPVSPSGNQLEKEIIQVSDSTQNTIPADFRNIFGAWKVLIDLTSLTPQVITARNASAIGDIFDSDLSQFLTVSPCSNCLSIASISMDDYSDLNIVFRIKHPFDNIATRPDLHGFDVRGIFITDYVFSPLFPAVDVLRPDGTKETKGPFDSAQGKQKDDKKKTKEEAEEGEVVE